MKKITTVLTALFFLLLSGSIIAQSRTGANYFAGKWNVLISGTPYGDLKRVYVLEKNNNTLTGAVLDSSGKEMAKFSKVELKETKVTLYYYAPGNDVSITLIKKDDDHVTGTVPGTFEARGERMK